VREEEEQGRGRRGTGKRSKREREKNLQLTNVDGRLERRRALCLRGPPPPPALLGLRARDRGLALPGRHARALYPDDAREPLPALVVGHRIIGRQGRGCGRGGGGAVAEVQASVAAVIDLVHDARGAVDAGRGAL